VLEVEPAELLRVLRLPDGCADLVFMSMVYHHLTDPSAGARECRRVLRKGGYVCIRNATRESDFPHRHFFPALRALIDSDLPSRRETESVFAVGGFATVVHQVVTQITAPTGRASSKNRPYMPTRSWRGSPMTISGKGWPRCGTPATR
jgi:SAM-dependent methyltransferase